MPYSKYFIMLADDDADDCLLFQQALGDLSIEQKPLTFDNGQALLDYLHEAIVLPDLLFLDINMPLKNGLEALKEIKSHKTLQHVPIVMFSTTRNPHTVQNAFGAGANLYACKPASYVQLVSLLQKILELEVGGLLSHRSMDRFLIETS